MRRRLQERSSSATRSGTGAAHCKWEVQGAFKLTLMKDLIEILIPSLFNKMDLN